MIYFIIGASGSGKTAALKGLQTTLNNYIIYDFDDIGVPENADKKWRQQSTEEWFKRLTADTVSINSCLLGQMVPGEILASPSVNKIKNINIILLECQDLIRIERLKNRSTYGANQHTLNWASWLRVHCVNPQWEQDVIKENSSPIMDFNKWDKLESWKEIANIGMLDTTYLSIEQVMMQIVSFIYNPMMA
jgi:dephospho-CoA kinase